MKLRIRIKENCINKKNSKRKDTKEKLQNARGTRVNKTEETRNDDVATTKDLPNSYNLLSRDNGYSRIETMHVDDAEERTKNKVTFKQEEIDELKSPVKITLISEENLDNLDDLNNRDLEFCIQGSFIQPPPDMFDFLDLDGISKWLKKTEVKELQKILDLELAEYMTVEAGKTPAPTIKKQPPIVILTNSPTKREGQCLLPSRLSVFKDDLECLDGDSMLNSSVINFYMETFTYAKSNMANSHYLISSDVWDNILLMATATQKGLGG